MPGLAHDVLIQALRDDMTLLPMLMAKLLGRWPKGKLRCVDSTVRFTRSAEVRPDVVYRRGRAWTLCEVQNKIDRKKAQSWAMAMAVLHLETRTMGDLVVITASPAVARWARKVAHHIGAAGTTSRLTPVVLLLDRRCIQALLDPQKPELALCAAWAVQKGHGEAAARIVEQALDLTDSLPPLLRDAQRRAILDVLSDRMRSRLHEATMHPDRVPESPATRKLRLFMESMGEKRGRAEGRSEGRAEGKREDLLLVLRERGLAPAAGERARIDACTDVEQLGEWLKRAITAASVVEVLGPEVIAKQAPKRARAARPAVRRGRASPQGASR